MVGLKKWSFIDILTFATVASASSEAVKSNFYTYGGENVSAQLIDNHLTVKCGPKRRSTVPFKNMENVKEVRMYSCPPPHDSYATELRTLNVNTSAIQKLLIHEITGDRLLRAKHFQELKIKELRIKNSYRQFLIPSSDAFELLTELTDLHLEKAGLPLLPKASNVKNITLENGKVSGGKLGGCNELRELNLIGTHPKNVSSNWLANCTKIKILRVKWLGKPLSQESLNNVLEGATNLQELDLTGCKLSTLPWDLLTQAKQLRRLVLKENLLNDIVLRDFKFNSLNYVDLKDCNINCLKGLPASNASQLEIDLSKNNLNDVQLKPEDYDMLENNNVTVIVSAATTHLNCYDCEHGWLWRAVREKRLIIDVRCNEGVTVKLGDADPRAIDHAECETYNCTEVPKCQCKRALSSSARWANCENMNLIKMPQEPELRKLYAAGNKISNIYAKDLPDSLQFIDLTNNSISMVNAAVVKKLFSVPERHVRLTGNPIACICDNKELLDALQTNHNRVDDYMSITCGSGDHVGEPISKLDPADLCSDSVHLGISLGVVTMICSSSFVLYYRYKLAIKVFLYTRGWCLCCVREEEIDADRTYDAFVSFSHEDANIVVEELVPKLESPPCSYKLCVHYRDWMPGVLISEQIKTSVARSRRTIIVLSRNYMKSIWGLMEFREAHINTLREGRVRVIVIVIDDVLENDNLDPELRAYLKANTYVKWVDPWFWDKLKYALPHRTTERIV